MNINKSVERLIENAKPFLSKEESQKIDMEIWEKMERVQREWNYKHFKSIQDAKRTYVYV